MCDRVIPPLSCAQLSHKAKQKLRPSLSAKKGENPNRTSGEVSTDALLDPPCPTL